MPASTCSTSPRASTHDRTSTPPAYDERGDSRAVLGCALGLGALVLLTAGASALPFLLSTFFWKFALPALVFVAVVGAFLAAITTGDEDSDPGPGPNDQQT